MFAAEIQDPTVYLSCVCHALLSALFLFMQCLLFSFLFCLTPSSCPCVYPVVSPVLTPPESEKADSEDRVSLKVCVSVSSLSFNHFSWWRKTKPPSLLSLSTHYFFFLLDAEKSRGSLHPHLCGAVQVSASREQRLGAPVSKTLLCTEPPHLLLGGGGRGIDLQLRIL